MNTDKYSLVLTAYEYSVLRKNYIISTLCEKQLATATKRQDEVELSLTFGELEELIGFVAAESNHARTNRQREDLGTICDYLESIEQAGRLTRGNV